MELSIILLSVGFVWSIAVVTPGPNFFITVQIAIGRSRRSALFVVLGISFGTIIWAISGFFGINLLFKTVPWVYFSLKLIGGAYLIYFGIKLIKSKYRKMSKGSSLNPKNIDLVKSFKFGLLTNLSNPKTATFVTSLYAATMPLDASYYVGFFSVVLMALISIIWYTFVAYIFSLSQFGSIYRRIRVWVERVAGIIFVSFGLKLAISD
jgi:threonine efflux protein